MPKIVHLSDLHFGKVRPELLQPLLDAVQGLAPDAVAISGDLTQRAREWQFEQAAMLIDELPGPILCVPGNHDIPLDRPLQRFLRPFGLYRSDINRDLEPMIDLPGMRLIGMNTADPTSWQRGRVRKRSLSQASQRLRAAPDTAVKVVVMHHPLVHPEGSTKEPMPNGEAAAEALAAAGADLVLTGHLHSWGAAAEVLREPRRAMLLVMAGTGLSTRQRGEENDFNVIETPDGPGGGVRLRVTRWAATVAGDGFAPVRSDEFVEGDSGWHRAD